MPVADAHQVRIHEISCVVRAVDTVDGQLSVDLIVKVVGESKNLTSIHRIFLEFARQLHGRHASQNKL